MIYNISQYFSMFIAVSNEEYTVAYFAYLYAFS